MMELSRFLPDKSNKYYPDIWIFIILVPFISAFNYYLTYPQIRFDSYLLLTFSIDTTQGYLAVWGVRVSVLYLDSVYPYDRNTIKRIIIQQLLITTVGLLIIIITTELVSFIAKGSRPHPSFYNEDVFIISIWFFVLNGIYIIIHFYHTWKLLAQNEAGIDGATGLLVKSGNKNLRLKFTNVLGFTVDSDYSIVIDHSGVKYYLDQSLNEIEELVPVSDFFRLNRQFILNRNLISGYHRLEQGKLEAILDKVPQFPNRVAISRLKASKFKKWFKENQPASQREI